MNTNKIRVDSWLETICGDDRSMIWNREKLMAVHERESPSMKTREFYG